MSNYPENLDVFVNRTGANYVASSDPNNAYDGVETTQGIIGALGKPQSWSTTLLTLLRKHQRGLRVEAVGGTLYVRAGEAVLESTDGNKFAFRRNTGDVTLSTAEIDVGTIAATFYYVYVQGGTAATTGPVVYSTDALAPYGVGTAPYTKIGWFKNEGAGSMAVTFAGNWREYSNEPNLSFIGALAVTAITADTYIDVDVMTLNYLSSGKPVKIYFRTSMSNSTQYSGACQKIAIDGTDQNISISTMDSSQQAAGGSSFHLHSCLVATLPAGSHVIQARWKRKGGTAYSLGRILCAEEV